MYVPQGWKNQLKYIPVHKILLHKGIMQLRVAA